jgi:hypothetical protein
MKWVLLAVAVAASICIAVYLVTGFGWEIGGPVTAALAGLCWWLGAMERTEQ